MLKSLTQKSFNSIYKFNKNLIINPFIGSQHRYNGRVKCVIFDWSGTLSDAGVLAPAVAFVDVFKNFNINITMEEARAPMGLRKDLHIADILKLPSTISQWKKKYGNYPTSGTANMIFQSFISLQLECLPTYSKIIPGADTTTNKLRKSGIKLGLTTGFTKNMSDILRTEGEKQGLILDSVVAGDEVKSGTRPYPSMLYKNLDLLGIDRIQSVVKVDDTSSGIEEAINAGCWSVGVCRWSNYTNYNSLKHLQWGASRLSSSS